MGNSSSSRRRNSQTQPAAANPNVTYAPPQTQYGPYVGPPPPFATGPQVLPGPSGYAGNPNYCPPYTTNGQYYQQGWNNTTPGAAPPGAPQGGQPPALPPAYPQTRPPATAPNGKPKDQQDFQQTATIRNTVNVKKDTIKLLPLDDDPTKLQIAFTFDCTQPCCVTTYVMASEDPESYKITTRSQIPAPPCIYEKGLAHKFPRLSNANSALHIVDLNQASADDLAGEHMPPDTFPFVIRLESLSEEGQAAGHTLESFKPGQEQRSWVQSQSTYGKILKNDDGEYEVRVVEQKIRIKGVTYKLQEIYGMGPAGVKADPKADADNEERLCVICLSNIRDTTVLPCRHMCMCKDCAQELAKQTSKCPICRNNVESLLHIKVQRKGRRSSSRKEKSGDGSKADSSKNMADAAKESARSVPAATATSPAKA